MTVDELREEFPGWRISQGFEDVWYARWLRSTPPVMVRAHNLGALRKRIRKAIEAAR